MGLRVTLDTTLLQNLPQGWDGAKYKSKRDADIKGLFTIYVTDLVFWGDGFDYIDTIMEDNYCQTIEVTIESDDCEAGVWKTEFNGIIKLTEITKVELDERTCTTKIFDESFGARINNNKSLKAYVDVGTSKNGEDITATIPEDISVFDPTANYGTYIGTPRKMFRAWNCFYFIIQYMTDGEVDFHSDVLDVGGEYYNTWITNGSELRQGNGDGDQLEVSFKDLFAELDKKYDLSFAVEPNPTGYTNPFRVRIEPTTYFEQDEGVIQLSNIKGMKMDFNKEALYSDVDIGSDNFDDDVTFSYPPLNFKTFREENYTILGQCNVDKTLDLVSKWIIDTNVIEDIVANSQDKYDDKNIIITTDNDNKALKSKPYGEPISIGSDTSGTTNKLTDSAANFTGDGVQIGYVAENLDTGEKTNITAIDSATVLSLSDDIFSSGDSYVVKDGPFAYNEPLNNYNVISRYLGGLANSVVKYLSKSSTAPFWAGITSSVIDTVFPATLSPVEYDDDSTLPFFDSGANYDTGNFYYDVPASGLYGFMARAIIKLNGQLSTTNSVANGDFSTTTDWSYNYGSIAVGKFSYSLSYQNAHIAYLRQSPVSANYAYVFSFECVITSGAITVFGQTFTTSGTKYINLDFRTSTPQQLSFGFVAGSISGNAIGSIDNVTLFSSPQFQIEQTIQRRSSSNSLLQSFTTNYTKVFAPTQFQDQDIYDAQNTFPIFKNERVYVKLVITSLNGSNLASELVPSTFTGPLSETVYTSFKTISVDDGGGDILPVEPSTFPIYKYEFKKALTFEEWNTLKNDPKSAVLFAKDSSNFLFGWRNSIEYDRTTGETEFVLRSKKKIKTNC